MPHGENSPEGVWQMPPFQLSGPSYSNDSSWGVWGERGVVGAGGGGGGGRERVFVLAVVHNRAHFYTEAPHSSELLIQCEEGVRLGLSGLPGGEQASGWGCSGQERAGWLPTGREDAAGPYESTRVCL